MRGGFGFGRVVFVIAVLAHASSASAKIQKSNAQHTNGEITVDVTVRARPQLTAPGIVDLPAGTPVRRARAKARGWARITEPTRGWIPAETFAGRRVRIAPSSAKHLGTQETAEGRLEGIAEEQGGSERSASKESTSEERPGAEPAPGMASPAATTRAASTPRETRSESELMLESLRASRGESPNAARIARVVRDTAIEVKRKRVATPLPTFWKDPFVDDGEPLALVLPRRWRGAAGRMAMRNTQAADSRAMQADLMAARRETARARADAAAARAESAAVRAESARVKAELARSEAAAAHADALEAKHDAAVARAGCSEDAPPRRAALGRGAGGREITLRAAARSERSRKVPRGPRAAKRVAVRRVTANGTAQARNSPAATAPMGAMLEEAAAGSSGVPALPTAPAIPAAQPVPAQPASASYRGILVVPIN